MQITKQIKNNKFNKLLRNVQKKVGFPYYYEELVIYLKSKIFDIKITVKANKGIKLLLRDHAGNQLLALSLKSNELKNILVVLKEIVGEDGHISISPVFEFNDDKSRKTIKLIKNSLAGSIITMINFENEDEFVQIISDDCLEGEYKEKIKMMEPEKIIDFSIGSYGVLNEKIIFYTERNGIHLNRNKKTTYKDVLNAKSNNYQGYADVFSLITKHNLIGNESLPTNVLSCLHATTVSIIIPCYNTEKTIHKVLDSISSQQINNNIYKLEVILIDDGSDQPLIDFIDPKSYPYKLQIVRLESNQGLSNARQIGLYTSSGDILIFHDSDVLLAKNYVQEHVVRNLIIPNAVFVSFKQNIEFNNPLITEKIIRKGLVVPDYSRDLRVHKNIRRGAVGSHEVKEDLEVEILESTNYFKSFNGSRIFGVYDLSCMVIGHNFSARKNTIIGASPFSNKIKDWGMEDVYFGLKLINDGNFIIPILSTGVYHIDHPPRSGSNEKKMEEYVRNTEIINKFLDTELIDNVDTLIHFSEL